MLFVLSCHRQKYNHTWDLTVEGGTSSVGDEDVFEKQIQEWMKEEPTCDDKGNFTDDDDTYRKRK